MLRGTRCVRAVARGVPKQEELTKNLRKAVEAEEDAWYRAALHECMPKDGEDGMKGELHKDVVFTTNQLRLCEENLLKSQKYRIVRNAQRKVGPTTAYGVFKAEKTREGVKRKAEEMKLFYKFQTQETIAEYEANAANNRAALRTLLGDQAASM